MTDAERAKAVRIIRRAVANEFSSREDALHRAKHQAHKGDKDIHLPDYEEDFKSGQNAIALIVEAFGN